MPQYRKGTAHISSSNPNTVILNNFGIVAGNVNIGNWFKFAGDGSTFYTIQSIDNINNSFTLSINYNGTKALDTDFAYLIQRDFTPNLKLPEIHPGDIETAHVYTRAMRMIDSLLAGVTTVTSNYTVTESDRVLLVSGNTTVNLPAAGTMTGKSLTVKKLDEAGVVTIDGFGTERIEGQPTYQLTGQYQSVTLVSNGSEWFITSLVEPAPMRPTGPDGSRIVFDNITIVEYVRVLSGWVFSTNDNISISDSVLLRRSFTGLGIDRLFPDDLVAIVVSNEDEQEP